MIAVTPEAKSQLEEFQRYYVEQQQPRDLQNFGHSLTEPSLVILDSLKYGLAVPRCYVGLATLGLPWLCMVDVESRMSRWDLVSVGHPPTPTTSFTDFD